METINFGVHFMLDGYGGDSKKLGDKDLVLNSLIELPEKMGMKRLSDAYVFEAVDNELNDPGGWSGFVVIAESHISIHTFPKRKFVSIDAYTCKNEIDREFIINYFKEVFKLEEVEENFVKRGTKYPAKNIC